MRVLLAFAFIVGLACAKDFPGLFTESSVVRILSRVYEQCDGSNDIIKCLKVQGAKLAGRALKVQNIKIIDGISIIKKPDSKNTQRSGFDTYLNNNDLDKLSSKSLDSVLFERLLKLVESHQLQVNIPKLLAFGQQQSKQFFEGRGKKKDDKKFLGPFIAAVMLKAGILKMAYHSIAIVAGKALIVGKIALIISAIIGLKKLVSSEGHEKTTYEIVKHPHYQQSHTYSSSHGEYEGGHEGGSSYHRSIGEEEMMMQDKAYRAHIPRSYQSQERQPT